MREDHNLELGELVRHPDHPDWGIGRVTESIQTYNQTNKTRGIRVKVFFPNHGEVVFKPHEGDILPVSEDSEVKLLLESYVRQKSKDTLQTLHRARLGFYGDPYKGVSLASVKFGARRRVTHCWGCKSDLDTECNFGCVSCGWLICHTCVRCGCGYKWTN